MLEAKSILVTLFEKMVEEEPRLIEMLPKFLKDLDCADLGGQFDRLVDAVQSRRPQTDHGDGADLKETTIVIEVAKSWRGHRKVIADVVVKAKHAGDFKADTDALAGISAAIMHMTEQVMPMPDGARIEFSHGGRVTRFGGDEITEDIAISMAEELIGAPRSDRQ
jgi:hypothetical protein